MFGNISLLTGICVVCFFLTKARGNVYFTNVTRDGDNDIFTKEFCEESCDHFGATNYSGGCKCTSSNSDSVFLRSKRKCVSGNVLRDNDEGCRLYWDFKVAMLNIKVISADEANSYTFVKPEYRSSCQLTPFIAFLDAAGNWTPFSLPGDVLEVVNGNIALSRSSTIKITRQSPILSNLSGHIIKLNLNCTGVQHSGVTCLMFRIKGVLKFPLCNYTTRTTTPSLPPPTSTPTSAVTTSTPSTITTPSTTTTTTPPDGGNTDWIIAAVVVIAIVLFLALIGAFVFLFKHYYICTFRSRQDVAREFDDFAAINSPGQQSYRIQEEPLYIELPDVYPSNRQIAGNSMEISEGKQSTEELVLSNSYAKDTSLPRTRPLPSRPDLDEKRHMENCTTAVYKSDGHEVNDQKDVSMVLMNPGVQVALLRSLPGMRTDVDDLPPAREKGETESDHQHHDTADGKFFVTMEISEGKQSTEELVLSNSYAKDASLPRTRPLPSRPDLDEKRHMENSTTPVYQSDGHEVKDQRDVSMVLMNPGVQVALLRSLPGMRSDVDDLPPVREKGVTESDHQHHDTADGAEEDQDVDYQGLAKGMRAKSMFICPTCNENSDYQRLSRQGHCPHERNNERREKSASFYESLTLERGTRESVYASPSRDDEDEERNAEQIPEYQVLEPEETGSDEVLDESVDHDYNVLEEPEPANGELDEDNNKIGDPRSTDENSGQSLEPSVILDTEDNPAYAVTLKKTINEKPELVRSEPDVHNNKIGDSRPTGENSREPLEPSVTLDTEDNPAYAVSLKKTITETPEPVRSELNKDDNKTRDHRPADENPEEPFEPPVLLKIDNNPLYSLPWKRNITEEPGRKRSYSM